jgi:hypothetical protein
MMLVLMSILTGVLTTFVIRRTTHAGALREARNRLLAHLMEFRLFFDEPVLVWNAQLALFRDNARILRLLLLPTLILALPMTWLWLQLDAHYGHSPLRLGESVVVTAQLTRPLALTERYELQGADAVVETPPVRITHDNQLAWRVHPARDHVGPLKVLPDKDVAGVTVNYPSRTLAWMLWFAAISTVAALLSAHWV